MPSYVFLLYGDMSLWEPDPDADPAAWEESMKKHEEFIAHVNASGATMLGGEALVSPADARTVRTTEDEQLVTDGPFAEVKEGLGGYYVIETTDFDAAMELARKCPEPIVEVRPVVPT